MESESGAVVVGGGDAGSTTPKTTAKDRKANKSSKASGGKRKGRRRGGYHGSGDHHFASYLSFGICPTIGLGCFFCCYILVLFILMPLLSMDISSTDNGEVDTKNGGFINNNPEDISLPDLHIKKYSKRVANELMKHKLGGVVGGSLLAGSVTNRLKKKVFEFKEGYGITDESLMKDAATEFTNLRKKRRDAMKLREERTSSLVKQPPPLSAGKAGGGAADNNNNAVVVVDEDNANNEPAQQNNNHQKRPGFFLLGMHRSGTSMLAGLLHKGSEYAVGGPLIGANFDNEKGFYELLPVVLQNDEFLKLQKATWQANVIAYNPDLAITHKNNGAATFRDGQKGLEFLNNPQNVPWVMKDPRMCITLPTWMKLMTNGEPAVVFTFRHPTEVAMSLKKREAGFTYEHGLRLWIVYNMRAIQNSKHLCRITTSNAAIFENPLDEVRRIVEELTTRCNVAPPPGQITQDDIDKFIDPSLHHNKKKDKKDKNKGRTLLSTEKDKDNGCMIYEREERTYPKGGPDDKRESQLYMIACRLHCDMETGKIYEPDYAWPALP